MRQAETQEINILTKKLDEACLIEFGTRVVQKKDGGAIYPVYGGGGATFKMDTYNRENCLVVSRFAMSKQCTRFVDGKFFLNDSGLTVRPKNEKELSQAYLDYLLLTLNDTIYSLSRGTAQRNLNVPKFRNLEISYPGSVELQLYIANILSKAENLIAQRKESIRLLDEFLKSKFLEMFGDPVRNEKGWEEKTMGDLTINENSKRIPIKEEVRNSRHGEFPYYGASGIIDWIDYYTHEGNRLLIGEDGANLIFRTTPVAFMAKGKYWVNNHAHVLNNNKFSNLRFVEFYINSIDLKKYITGSAQPKLNRNKLDSIKIYQPPISLQNKFAQIVEKTEALKSQYQQSLQELENLYGSLSQKAFRGELTNKSLTV